MGRSKGQLFRLCSRRNSGIGLSVGHASRSKEGESDMSIFGDIMSKIFGSREAAAAQPASAANAAPAAGSPSAAGSAPAQTGAATASAGQKVDVEAILADMAAKNRQQLNWRTSIVDLMKLLNLDSSLQARQA